LLNVVVKNLADPTKAQDPKYCQLKLDNEKIKAKLACHPSAVNFLLSIGFAHGVVDETTGATAVLRMPMETAINTSLMTASLQQIVEGIETVAAATVVTVEQQNNINKKPRVEDPLNKLTEKQKARILTEQKEQLDKQAAKAYRKKNVDQLKQDKHVRLNDPNWTSGVSAACAKTGTGIETFRDKFGEGE
jgi:hypothetical protein